MTLHVSCLLATKRWLLLQVTISKHFLCNIKDYLARNKYYRKLLRQRQLPHVWSVSFIPKLFITIYICTVFCFFFFFCCNVRVWMFQSSLVFVCFPYFVYSKLRIKKITVHMLWYFVICSIIVLSKIWYHIRLFLSFETG